MAEIVSIERERTEVETVLIEAARDHANYERVAVIGLDHNGDVAFASSGLNSAEFVYLLLDAIDAIRRPAED